MEDGKLGVVRKLIEQGVAKHDEQAFNGCMAEDIIEHQPGFPQNREGVRQELWKLKGYLPDIKFDLQHSAVDGDMVWVHYEVSGTHTGNPLMGHPATGKKVKINLIDICRVKDDLIVEHWGIPDRLEMMRQLGFLGK